jgi:hypothetical protein
MFDQFSRVTPRMVGWHFPLLLYGVVVAAVLFCRSAIQAEGLRDGVLIEGADREDYRAEVLVSWITTGYWVLTLALVWWAPWAGIPWLFTSLFATLVRSAVRRRLRSAPA